MSEKLTSVANLLDAVETFAKDHEEDACVFCGWGWSRDPIDHHKDCEIGLLVGTADSQRQRDHALRLEAVRAALEAAADFLAGPLGEQIRRLDPAAIVAGLEGK